MINNWASCVHLNIYAIVGFVCDLSRLVFKISVRSSYLVNTLLALDILSAMALMVVGYGCIILCS